MEQSRAARPRWDAGTTKVAGIVDSDAHREELSTVTFLVSVGRRVRDLVEESEARAPRRRGRGRRPMTWSGVSVYAQRVTR